MKSIEARPVFACACEPPSWRNPWLRIGLGALIAMNSMMLAVSVNVSDTTASERHLLHSILLGASLVVFALLGWPLLQAALRSLVKRQLTIDLLFVVGVVGAVAASCLSMIRGTGPVFFEVSSILLVVYSGGRELTRSAEIRALDLFAPLLRDARYESEIEGTGWTAVPVEELRAGALVRVPPGGRIPAEALVMSGSSLIEQAMVTGEALPRRAAPGDLLPAGALLVDGLLTVQLAESVPERPPLIETLDAGMRRTARFDWLTDVLSRWFLPAILLCAVATFLWWWHAADAMTAVWNAMAVLLIACPCAIGFATPLAVWAAVHRMAQAGVQVKDTGLIEAMADAETIAFDKTGTLTEPEPILRQLRFTPEWEPRADLLRPLIALIESNSGHVLARPFARLSEHQHLFGVELQSLQVVAGKGVHADVRLGSGSMTVGIDIGLPDESAMTREERSWCEEESSIEGSERRIGVWVQGQLAAMAMLGEALTASAQATLAELETLGVRTAVISGDAGVRVDATGVQERYASQAPGQKSALLREWRNNGRRVLFVGDGFNDAPAMPVAAGSIAVLNATALTREIASGILTTSDLRAIPAALRIARQASRLLRSNLIIAATYNVAGVVLAATGHLHPVAAALIMVLSSLFVIARASAFLSEGDSSSHA